MRIIYIRSWSFRARALGPTGPEEILVIDEAKAHHPPALVAQEPHEIGIGAFGDGQEIGVGRVKAQTSPLHGSRTKALRVASKVNWSVPECSATLAGPVIGES